MKNVRRQQKHIDKARSRLFGWATHSQEGTEGITRTVDTITTLIAQHSGHPFYKVASALAQEPFGEATHIFTLLLWLIGEDHEDKTNTPIARYIAELGRSETSVGRLWLKEFAASRFEFRDVLAVTKQTSLKLDAPNTSGSPVTVYERRLAIDPLLGLVIYARVLPMPAGSVLADGMLILDPRMVATLPTHPCARDVFVAWATDGLVAEGLLPGKPHHPSQELPSDSRPFQNGAGATASQPPQDRTVNTSKTADTAQANEKLLARVRKLFAMAQETEASPHEAEIALRRCQSLMAKFGISEKDLETSEFGRQKTHSGKRVPMHIQFLSIAVAELHDVLFVSGGGDSAHFRGYDLDVRVASLTLDYLSDAVDRALTDRRRAGDFPPGRIASYDYRLAFAKEVGKRVRTIVRERKVKEQEASTTGTALTVRKLEIVKRECGQDLITNTIRTRGAINQTATNAGREDGSHVSLDPQVEHSKAPALRTK